MHFARVVALGVALALSASSVARAETTSVSSGAAEEHNDLWGPPGHIPTAKRIVVYTELGLSIAALAYGGYKELQFLGYAGDMRDFKAQHGDVSKFCATTPGVANPTCDQWSDLKEKRFRAGQQGGMWTLGFGVGGLLVTMLTAVLWPNTTSSILHVGLDLAPQRSGVQLFGSF